jgi:leucyl aminopeptidase
MSITSIRVSNKVPALKSDQAIVIGLKTKAKDFEIASQFPLSGLPSVSDFKKLGAKSSFESLTRVIVDGRLVLAVGLGETNPSPDELRELAGAAARNLSEFGEIVLNLPHDSEDAALALMEGAALAHYENNDFKSGKRPLPDSSLIVVSSKKVANAQIEQVLAIVRAVENTRTLVNMPPNELYPKSLAARIQKLAKNAPVTVEVWDEAKLRAEKCIGILSVGQGSVRPPRLVKISYRPKGAKKHLALVGKGITFDSGGLTLKPGPGMLGMKYDMTGAATIGLATLAIAELGLPVRVTAYLCVAENLPSGSATRPNDVIKFRNGKTVEVTNTDAEGRLVLADGLILASESQPDLIVDVATLTGAARVALGVRTTGLMGTDVGVESLKAAAKKSGEHVWHMPMPKELRNLLNSDTADLINSKLGDPSGGMLVGAHFLAEFVGVKKGTKEMLPWAHLDIAGPANNDGAPYGYTPKGATGVMLRTLVEVAKSL